MNITEQVAHALLDIGALHFQPNKPITFKSGIVSPVYVDNRRLPFHPIQWRVVIEGFGQLLDRNRWLCDVIAGVAMAGVPHSAALAFYRQTPSVFVRKEAKEHGTGQLIEGGDVQDQVVILVEDMVTTGGSSLKAVQTLRTAGAIAEHCLCITTYGFAEKAFQEMGVELHALVEFSTLVEMAVSRGELTQEQCSIILDWLSDAHEWAKKHGF